MRVTDKTEVNAPDTDSSGTDTYEHAPRKMTVAQNVILTVKVLAGFGLMGAALWGISLWKSAP